MTLGKACEPHNIPATICVACRAAEQERERIIELIEKSFSEEFRGYRANIIDLIKTLA